MNTTVDTIVDTYRTILKREPDADGLAFWMKSFDNFVQELGVDGAKSRLTEMFKDSQEYKENFGGK